MPLSRPRVFRYYLNKKLRNALHWVISSITPRQTPERLNFRNEQIKKILIVRATFRMGASLLAIPAIISFRKHFPHGRIDFLGAPISTELFKNLPIDNHFTITRRYPGSGLDYPILLRRLRSVRYDLAVDVSCSQSAMASFLVGFSGARFRVGLQGKWDHLFNVRIPKPSERNKYRILPEFLESLGLECDSGLPSIMLSAAEKEIGRRKIEALVSNDSASRIVGVFVGGRKSWGKRWPVRNFCELITALYSQRLNVITFVGPEEKDSISYLRDALDPELPVIFESSPRDFAAMVSSCDLFVTCDSGPVHMACGLGVRTVAIFLYKNFDHWGPPANCARIVYERDGCSVEGVFKACCEELSGDDIPVREMSREKAFRSPCFPMEEKPSGSRQD
jgi:ADP-heptose:LPS heptosyltransferase